MARLVLIPLVSYSVRLWVISIEGKPVERSLFHNFFFFLAKGGPLGAGQQHDLFSFVVSVIYRFGVTEWIWYCSSHLTHSESDLNIIVYVIVDTIKEIHEFFSIIIDLRAEKLFSVLVFFDLTFLAFLYRVKVGEVGILARDHLKIFCIIRLL